MQMSSKQNLAKKEMFQRRDAFKVLGLGSASLLLGTQTKAEAKTRLSIPASHKKVKIIIAGGGTGGMIAAEMAAYSPSYVDRLVLAAPAGTWRSSDPVADLLSMTANELQDNLWSSASSSMRWCRTAFFFTIVLRLPYVLGNIFHRVHITLRASLSGTSLQTLPDLVTPLKGNSLSPRFCPPTRSAPSERSGY